MNDKSEAEASAGRDSGTVHNTLKHALRRRRQRSYALLRFWRIRHCFDIAGCGEGQCKTRPMYPTGTQIAKVDKESNWGAWRPLEIVRVIKMCKRKVHQTKRIESIYK